MVRKVKESPPWCLCIEAPNFRCVTTGWTLVDMTNLGEYMIDTLRVGGLKAKYKVRNVNDLNPPWNVIAKSAAKSGAIWRKSTQLENCDE